LVHLFLIRQPGGDVFVHLHPRRAEAASEDLFVTRLPPLPVGDYQMFADIARESGLTQTMTNRLHLEASVAAAKEEKTTADTDDSFCLAAPAPPVISILADRSRLMPLFPAKIRLNEPVSLAFNLISESGEPAPLEPYLGMYGHLLIQRADGEVFAHVHPLGTISMTAQRSFAEREHAGYLASQPLDLLCAPPSRVLSFPYAFPRPGAYRLWLQIKLAGRITTAAYSVEVD
jgi:hypothetical protein